MDLNALERRFGRRLPGLIIETLPSGANRIRVRVAGKPKARVTIPHDLADPDFVTAYEAARQGLAISYQPMKLHYLQRQQGFIPTLSHLLARSKQRAVRRNLPFRLILDDLLEQLDRQDGKCAVSGMEFDIRPNPRRGDKRPFCMSIDRIDNSQGYIRQNIRITTVMVNMARLNWSDDEFRRMCRAVARNAPKCPTP